MSLGSLSKLTFEKPGCEFVCEVLIFDVGLVFELGWAECSC